MSEKFEEMFTEIKFSSTQLVVGSAIGSYIGFSISKQGVIDNKYINLSALLIVLTVFVAVTSLIVRIRYVRIENRKDVVRALIQLGTIPILGALAIWQATIIGLDGETLFYLLVSWVFALTLDSWGKRQKPEAMHND